MQAWLKNRNEKTVLGAGSSRPLPQEGKEIISNTKVVFDPFLRFAFRTQGSVILEIEGYLTDQTGSDGTQQRSSGRSRRASNSHSVRGRDVDLQAQILNALTKRGARCLRSIEIKVANGCVFFRGVVPTFYDRQLYIACQHIPGVVKIIDRLEVREAGPPDHLLNES